jgi:hypothetical protein
MREVMALILRLMDDTGIRIGSEEYEKVNGSMIDHNKRSS